MRSAQDIVRTYFEEIGRIPLLSRSEDLFYGKQLKKGRTRKIRDRAKFALVEANLRLSANIAKKHVLRGMDLLDLIQTGNFGLFRAVDEREGYDYTTGNRFATYAGYWVRQKIGAALQSQSRTIRIGRGFAEKLERYGNVRNYLLGQLCRQPTEDELCSETGFEPELLRALEKGTIFTQKINDQEVLSLLGGRDGIPPEEKVYKMEVSGIIDLALRIFPPREQIVISMRFGLRGRVYTLQEVADQFNVTREAIRAAQNKALKKLKESELMQAINPHRIFNF